MRYTHKLDKPDGNCNYFLIPDQEQCDAVENKLGQLEDLEDELGIDLIVLFKALKSGIYHKIGNCLYFRDNLDFDFNSHLLFKNIYGSYTVFDTKDYGKTWALTEEELL